MAASEAVRRIKKGTVTMSKYGTRFNTYTKYLEHMNYTTYSEIRKGGAIA